MYSSAGFVASKRGSFHLSRLNSFGIISDSIFVVRLLSTSFFVQYYNHVVGTTVYYSCIPNICPKTTSTSNITTPASAYFFLNESNKMQVGAQYIFSFS